MSDVSICIVYDSSFKGQTKVLADSVAAGAASVTGTAVHVIHVSEVEGRWTDLHQADAIIFGSPTYIGSVSAAFKAFIEQLAGDVWLKRMWKNKLAAGFTVSAGRSGDKLNCLMQMVIFASQMGMIWVPQIELGGNYSTQGSEEDLNRMAGYLGVMAQANIDEPAEVAPPDSDKKTAEIHGRHVAQIAAQLKAGQAALPLPDEAPFNGEGRPAGLKELSD